MLLGSGLGLTSVVLELSEAVAKHHSKSVSTKLKVISGSLGVVGLAVDTAFSAINAFSRVQKNDLDAATAYGIQAVAFAGAAVVSGFSVALGANAVTTAGVGLSWTGWALILIAAGMTAGYVAALLQDTPSEEWVARSIWGGASDQWGSIKREQQALNKILLGLSVEFDYGQSLIDNLGTSAAEADNPLALGRPDKSYFNEARLRVLIPEVLKEKLQWSIEIYLHRLGDSKLLAYSTGNTTPPSASPARLEGVSPAEIVHHSSDLSVVTIRAQMLVYPGASANITLHDDEGDGQLLISEEFLVR